MQALAQSQNYLIEHEYEVVWLVLGDGRRVVIGDFYGDPQAALISSDERWCAVAGAGIIVYWLHEPFEEFHSGRSSSQYKELFRSPNENISIGKLMQTDTTSFSATTESGETYNISLDAHTASGSAQR